MIEESYPSPNKAKPYSVTTSFVVYPNQRDKDLAQKLGISVEEVLRRNQIIQTNWRISRLYTNCKAKPRQDEEYEKWGILNVTHMCSSIHDYKEKWPEDDIPFIVTAWSPKQEKYIVFTHNYAEVAPYVSAC